MATTPSLTLRANRQVELVFPHRRDLLAFEVAGEHTLDGAFAGATAMFQVRSGGTFRSPGIKARRLGLTQYNNRGLTRTTYDPEDYWVAAGDLPNDAQQAYLRVAEVAPDGTVQAQGPIYVVPPPNFFSNPRPVMTLRGTAPAVVVPADLLPPPTAMHIVLPQFADNVRIQNLSASDELLVSFGAGQPLLTLEPTATGSAAETLYDAAFKELFLCGNGATVAFGARIAVVNPEMG